MLSTVYETEAQKQVMQASIPMDVVNWLIDNDAIYRMYTMSRDLEHAG